MPCHADKHVLTLYLTCELYEQLCQAAQITGCGDDLDLYIKRLITDRC